MGNKLPLVPWKDISDTKETYSNNNLLSISSSHRAPYILQTKSSMFMISMTISLGLSCMNACMEPFLKYSETIFKEMLIYMIIIYEMLMICMCHMDDLISENLVSKIAGANLWNYLPSFVKNSQSIRIFKKNMRHYLVEKKGTRKGFVNSLFASDAHGSMCRWFGSASV